MNRTLAAAQRKASCSAKGGQWRWSWTHQIRTCSLNTLSFDVQVDRTLAAEQKKADFLPKADGGATLELERPTDAALLAMALLRAAARVASANLHGANLSSCLAQVHLRYAVQMCTEVLQVDIRPAA